LNAHCPYCGVVVTRAGPSRFKHEAPLCGEWKSGQVDYGVLAHEFMVAEMAALAAHVTVPVQPAAAPARTYPTVRVSVMLYDEVKVLPLYSDQGDFPDSPNVFAATLVPDWPITALWPLSWLSAEDLPALAP